MKAQRRGDLSVGLRCLRAPGRDKELTKGNNTHSYVRNEVKKLKNLMNTTS